MQKVFDFVPQLQKQKKELKKENTNFVVDF